MPRTSIEWATHTSNWLAGCTKVSPACTHCYAEGMTRRLASGLGSGLPRYQAGVVDLDTGRWTGRIAYDADALHRTFQGLAAARKPRRVFINSMSDTFHDDAPPESLAELFTAIRMLGDEHGHVLMLLTKRPANLLAWQRTYFPVGLPSWVWVGCTVEDQQRADERVPMLLQVRASVRFLSCEPLTGPVDLTQVAWSSSPDPAWRFDVLRGRYGVPGVWAADAGGSVHWIIAGGESGPKARPSHPQWFLDLRDQCVAAGVPFFFKQWGEWAPDESHHGIGRPERVAMSPAGRLDAHEAFHPDLGDVDMVRVGKHAAGRLLDGRTWDEVPDGR